MMALSSAPRIDRYSELNRNTLHATVTHFQGLRADVVGLRHTPRNPDLEENENNNLNPIKPVLQRSQAKATQSKSSTLHQQGANPSKYCHKISLLNNPNLRFASCRQGWLGDFGGKGCGKPDILFDSDEKPIVSGLTLAYTVRKKSDELRPKLPWMATCI